MAKTALVQHINNSFKRCAEGEFSVTNSVGINFCGDQSALACLKGVV